MQSANIRQIKEGKASFRHIHLLNAAKIFNRNMNWIYGLSKDPVLHADQGDPFDIIDNQLDILKNTLKPKLKPVHKKRAV